MKDINSPIRYPWSYGWGGEGAPTVTPLLKAIIETDRYEMERLYSQGATLEHLDAEALQRVLYHVVGNYPVMEWLVQHGYSVIEYDIRNATTGGGIVVSQECTSEAGYVSGLSGRAYFLGAYDVFELLVANGFDAFYCYEKGWAKAKKADEEIFKKKDSRAIRILMENGYSADVDYVLGNSQVRRKTMALDPMKYASRIPEPALQPVPLLMGRGEVKRRNARRLEDHADRVRVHREFVQKYGRDNIDACRREEEMSKHRMRMALQALADSF